MIKLFKKLFGIRSKKAKPVVPPIWPYKQSKRKMKGNWDIT